MHRLIASAALAATLLAAAGCRSTLTDERVHQIHSGALISRSLKSYHLVYSENDRKVGYLKVFDVQEGGGPTYPWRYVYDLDFNELGYIDQFGNAYRNVPYGTFQQEIHDKSFRVDRLPADTLEANVMRMLGINPAFDNVTFPVASSADLVGAP